MRRDNFKERSSRSNGRGNGKLEDKSPIREPLIVLSFRDFDRNQGESFEEWQESELLALALTRLSQICQKTLAQALTESSVKIYGKVDFPPNSKFTHPKHVPIGIKWASIRIQGKERVIGHFEDNVFHIVFLDEKHLFWPSEKKNT